jgi:hypothetical protein
MADDAEQALAPASIAEDLVAARDALTEEVEPKTFDLPGYGPKLQVKYNVFERTDTKESRGLTFRLAQAGEENADIIGMCKALTLACVAFYEEVDGESVLLNETRSLGDDPIRWGDERLANLLGIETGPKLKARDVMEGVLPKPELIEIHHSEVSGWSDRALARLDADF